MALVSQVVASVRSAGVAIGGFLRRTAKGTWDGFSYVVKTVYNATVDTAKARFNDLGQYTMDYDYYVEPPDKRLNWITSTILYFLVGWEAQLLSVTLIPLFYNSYESFKEYVSKQVVRGLDHAMDYGDANGFSWWNVYAAPGYVLGNGLGLIARSAINVASFLKNSFISSQYGFALTANWALVDAEVDKWQENEEELARSLTQQRFGYLGYGLGAVVGLISVPFRLMFRVAANSVIYFGTGVRQVVSPFWNDLYSIESSETSKNSSAQSINNKKTYWGYTLPAWLGSPGYLLGGAVGAGVIAPLSIVIRVVGGSAYVVAKQAFQWGKWTFELGSEKQETQSDDTSTKGIWENFTRNDIYSIPGYIGCGVVVPLSILLTALTRVPVHSMVSFWNTLATGINLSQVDNWKDAERVIEGGSSVQLLPVIRRNSTHRILGIPGYVLGAVGGAIGFTVAGTGRILYHSAISMLYGFVRAIDFVQSDLGEKKIITVTEDPRSPTHKFLGGIGYAVSYGAGLLIGVPVLGVTRLIGNSIRAVIISVTYASLVPFSKNSEDIGYANLYLSQNWTERTGLQIFFSLPGYIASVVVVPPIFGVSGLLRIGKNTIETAFATVEKSMKWAYYLGDAESYQYVSQEEISSDIATKLSTEKFYWMVNNILGIPGYLLAVPLTILGVGGTFVGRFAYNTTLNALEGFTEGVNQTLRGLSHPPFFDSDKRTFIQKSMGILGYIPGALFFVVGATATFTALSIENSYTLGKKAFISVLNFSLDKPAEGGLTENDTLFTKGFLGYCIGGGVGFCCAAAWGLTKNTLRSAMYMSGSLLNVGVGHPYFETTVKTDNRSIGEKGLGAVGYFVALGIVGSVASVYLVARNLPYLSVVPALVFSPLIAARKVLKLWTSPRFEKISASPQAKSLGEKPIISKEQKFKNLFSSLNAYGRFPEGQAIREKDAHNQPLDGGKGSYSFMRQSLTFNLRTETEFILHAIHRAFKENKDIASEWSNKIKPAVLERYGLPEQSSSIIDFATKNERVDKNYLINYIGNFILNYVKNSASEAPVFKASYAAAETSMTSVITGERPVQTQAEVVSYTYPVAQVISQHGVFNTSGETEKEEQLQVAEVVPVLAGTG